MDERHLVDALRYVSLNPVRARLVERAADWPWSSARAHLAGRDDGLVKVAPALERVGNFVVFLAETIARPPGAEAWLAELERASGRQLTPKKRGPKPRAGDRLGD